MNVLCDSIRDHFTRHFDSEHLLILETLFAALGEESFGIWNQTISGDSDVLGHRPDSSIALWQLHLRQDNLLRSDDDSIFASHTHDRAINQKPCENSASVSFENLL